VDAADGRRMDFAEEGMTTLRIVTGNSKLFAPPVIVEGLSITVPVTDTPKSGDATSESIMVTQASIETDAFVSATNAQEGTQTREP
jgi:hypothetical protein